MKLNQNILSPYNNFNKVDVSQITVSGDDKTYLAEKLLDIYKYSEMPSGYEEQLKYLDRKIEATRKTISSWESYRISAVAENEEELRQKLGTLQPNTGLVVNALNDASVTINNQSYSRGDIIFKDINNQQHIIRSYSGGYYFPAQLMAFTKTTISDDGSPITTPTGSYELYYKYATSIPSENESENAPDIADGSLEVPVSNIKATLTSANTNTSYNIRATVEDGADKGITVPMIEEDSIYIYPVVAWTLILSDHTSGERVYFDKEYTINGSHEIQLVNHTNFEWLKVEVR